MTTIAVPLSDDELDHFIRAWELDFGETLSRDRARLEIERLLYFFVSVGREMHPSPGPIATD